MADRKKKKPKKKKAPPAITHMMPGGEKMMGKNHPKDMPPKGMM